jgi:hypothetical protein
MDRVALSRLHHFDPDVDVTTSVCRHPIEYFIHNYWLAMLTRAILMIVVTQRGCFFILGHCTCTRPLR